MITHEGYVILSNICFGLVTMDMQPPTDSELSIIESNVLPQNTITSDLGWNPF